jgi:2-dehydro-3-deoxygluconokinase
MYDFVSVGEVLLRMSPPGFERLRSATRLDVHAVGSQLNVAAGLARLGKRTAFVSKFPAGELGLLARDRCLAYGVDMSHVKFVDGARIGVLYVEYSAAPRTGVAVYDRAGSAAASIAPGEFDWPRILKGSRLAETDGIFPGLSESCRETALEFLKAAREQGCTTCFDVNYREHLWTPERARDAWRPLLPYVDIVATNRSVSEMVFGHSGTDEEIMHRYAEEFGCSTVCLTSREMNGVLRGAWSSAALKGGQITQGRRFEFDVVDRFGTGDAWFAGFLYGYLEGDIQFALDFSNALCALAHTIHGDVAHVSVQEVMQLLKDDRDFRVRR